jgi:hypothetical protein
MGTTAEFGRLRTHGNSAWWMLSYDNKLRQLPPGTWTKRPLLLAYAILFC